MAQGLKQEKGYSQLLRIDTFLLFIASMATSFPSSTATMANTPDVVPRLPEPTPSEETTQTEPTELPTSPTKQADKSPTEPRTSPTKHADESLTKESQDMSSEKQQWISEEQHNGPPMQDIKHDPRAGSGIEFVSPQEELEEKQVNPSSPENEESSPKYGVPKPESEGLETVPGQNEGQENRPVYINNDEEQGSNSGRNAEETDWHFSFWDCWKSGSLGTFLLAMHNTYKYLLLPTNKATNRHRIPLLPLRPSRPNSPTSSLPTCLK